MPSDIQPNVTASPDGSAPAPSARGHIPLLARADLWAGLAAAAFGAGVLWVGADYPVGQAGRIGPGYAPRLLGATAVALGALLVARSLVGREAVDAVFRPRPVLLVLASVLAFAAVFQGLGLVPAVLATVAVANWASPDNGWRSAVTLGVVLALFSWALFVVALKLPIPVFRI